MSGPASPGQQVCTGRRARSTSLPSHTISWHGADFRSFGAICITCMNSGPRVLPRILQALRRLRLLEEREQLADFAQRRDRLLAHAQRDARAACRTDCRARECAEPAAPSKPLGFSNSSAGPPAFSTRSQISVISRRGSTSARDALQLAAALELREKVAEVGVFHSRNRVGVAIDPSAQFTVALRQRRSFAHRACDRGASSRVRMRGRHAPVQWGMPPAHAPHRPAIHPRAPRDLRHRARELPALVLPPHGARRDRERARARVRHQQRAAGHARRHVLLRVHGAAGSRRRAGGHDGAATDPGSGFARRGARLDRVRARADMGNRRRSDARWSASASRSRSSRSSR